jgi:hypothetical protein
MIRKRQHHRFLTILPFIVLFCFVSGLFTATGAEMFVYPAKGQSQEQQSKDEYACHQWAVQQTGFDPTKQQPSSSGKSSSGGGDIVKGGAVGALLGLGIGSLAGQSGTGAAIGAGAGALFGGLRRHDKDKQQEAAQQQAQANQQAMMHKYNTAKQACLEAKGYSVKQ